MRFTASLAVVAAAVVVPALAQSVTISATPLVQCADTTITISGNSGPYYAAVVPASDPCTDDAIAEFYDIASGTQDYYVASPSGTSVQIYVMDVNGVENWSQIYTVGAGDSSCLGGGNAAQDPSTSSTDPAPAPATTSTPDATTYTPDASTSSTSAPALYVAPSPSTTAAATTHANTGSGSGSTSSGSGSGTSDNTTGSGGSVAPANAASDSANGASSLSASVTLLVGAFAAVVALF